MAISLFQKNCRLYVLWLKYWRFNFTSTDLYYLDILSISHLTIVFFFNQKISSIISIHNGLKTIVVSENLQAFKRVNFIFFKQIVWIQIHATTARICLIYRRNKIVHCRKLNYFSDWNKSYRSRCKYEHKNVFWYNDDNNLRLRYYNCT